MTPAQRQAARHGFRAFPTPITGIAPMSPDQVRASMEQLQQALATDNKEAGQAATLDLIAGFAVNIARIAEALTPSPPSG